MRETYNDYVAKYVDKKFYDHDAKEDFLVEAISYFDGKTGGPQRFQAECAR